MRKTMIALSKVFEHVYINASDYLMLIGLGCILSYIYSAYGFATSLLFVGVMLVLASLMLEIIRMSNRK